MPDVTQEDIREEATARVLVSLNAAFNADPAAIHSLMVNRVPCDDALADHPTLPVDVIPLENTGSERYAVGALGLLNLLMAEFSDHRLEVQFSAEPVDREGRRSIVGFQTRARRTPVAPFPRG